ncbi:Putative AC transposase [Linum grandiflorum]
MSVERVQSTADAPAQENDNGVVNGLVPESVANGNGNGEAVQANAGNGNVEEVIDIGRLKSPVWSHYIKVQINGMVKAKCNYCKKLFVGDSNSGTTHLKNHTKICTKKKIKDGSQKILGPHYLAKGKQDLVATAFNSDFLKRELAIAITMHEYPLSIVDHLYFKRFVCSLQPLFTVPSRNTIKKEVFKIYDSERGKIQRVLDNNIGRIAITTDMWTATNQKKGYMAITAHYNDNSWVLRSLMLRFAYLPAPHTAERLATVLVDCLLDWNVDTKVSTITLDNCSTNDSMVRIIQSKLSLPYLISEGALIHMRCSAHILNLIVKDGLDVVKEGIENIRDSVLYWSATPKRLEYFQETAKQCRFTSVIRLVMDCPTRWNSTFEMLSVVIPYKEVFIRLKKHDAQYNCLPSNEQWQFAALVCEKLQAFSSVSKLISGTNYPTANLFFPLMCELRLQMNQWCFDPNEVIRKTAGSMLAKFSKYWDEIHKVLAIGVILDPRYKLEIVEYYAEKFGADGSCLESVKGILAGLVSEYQTKLNEAKTSNVSVGVESSTSSAANPDFYRFVSQRKKAKVTSVQTELDNYLNEEILPSEECENDFNILMWWKQNGPKYPILQAIARDVLAIPVTSVASECAFSSGGRLLDPHRSRLHHVTVETLMCARSWLQNDLAKGVLEGCFSSLIEDNLAHIESETEGIEQVLHNKILED